jgi:hypothetical protein
MPLSLLLLLFVLHVAHAFLGARRLYTEQAGDPLWTGGVSMDPMEHKMEDKIKDNMEASMELQEPQKTTEEHSALHSSQVKLQKQFCSRECSIILKYFCPHYTISNFYFNSLQNSVTFPRRSLGGIF